jgi:hypothetical protein
MAKHALKALPQKETNRKRAKGCLNTYKKYLFILVVQ